MKDALGGAAMEIVMKPVAYVHSSRTEATDDGWGAEDAWIELAPGYGPGSLSGLDGFSHAEIIFHFHRADPAKILTGAGHPRSNAAWPLVGIFAQRKKDRPNMLGSTIVAVKGIDGNKLLVGPLDAVDGTPVLDIKPVFREFLPDAPVRQPPWADELMKGYW
jgi:tRNA (adenine37-N6)-methyltransferase